MNFIYFWIAGYLLTIFIYVFSASMQDGGASEKDREGIRIAVFFGVFIWPLFIVFMLAYVSAYLLKGKDEKSD